MLLFISYILLQLHFGPSQWEKVRVDGTRKLRWQSVPDTFDVEKGVVSSSSFAAVPSTLNPRASTEGTNSKLSPIYVRKVMKLDNLCSTEHQHSATSNLIKGMENSAICNVKNYSSGVKCKMGLPLLKNADPDKSISPVKNDKSQSSSTETVFPLKKDGHFIVIKLPPSQFQSSLMEDLDDVRSFLNMTECTYEDRLVKSLSELVKKHQVLDRKLQKADEALHENSTLKAKLESFEHILFENLQMKEKLKIYKEREAQNLVLQEKVRYYEQRVNMVAKEAISEIDPKVRGAHLDDSSGASNDSDFTPVRWVSPGVAFSDPNQVPERNQHTFVSLDDQL